MRKLFFLFVFLLILTTANAKLSILDEQHTTESYSKRVTLFEKLSSLLSSLIQNNNADFGTKVVSFRKLSGLASPLFQNTNTNFDAKVVSFRKLDSLLTIQKIHGTDSFGFNVFVNSTVQEESLLEKYAPVLYFHPDEQFFPTTIDAMLNESDLKEDDPIFDDLIDEMPVAVESLSAPDVTDEYFLDLRNASGGLDPKGEIPSGERFSSYLWNIYAKEDSLQTGETVLQYWFFYPYNDWENNHEGDWEMIQIILDNSLEPSNTTYSFHWGGRTINWQDIEKIDETHPKVFVTLGGHGSWSSAGIHEWIQFELGCTEKADITSGNGQVLYPSDYFITSLQNQSWINFPGNWGELGIPGTSGPVSPPLVDYGAGNRWDDPLDWSGNPLPSLYTICTGSPVDIHAFDKNGNHVGLESGNVTTEIEGTYLYLPSDNESELMVILGSNPISFVINGTGVGAFNLSIGYYNRNSTSNYTLRYKNIPVNEKTSAFLNINSTNPSFVLQIDNNGDGIIDNTTIPDEIFGNVTQLEIDSDTDGFSDSIDNCPNLYNPNQFTDFDGDGFDNLQCGGNDCDDSNVFIHPNTLEVCNNIDDNCDNKVDDIDSDNDGQNDCNEVDLCLHSIEDNFIELKPNRLTGYWNGCSCTDILACKPGSNAEELKYGCTKGTIDNWLNKRGWAEDCY